MDEQSYWTAVSESRIALEYTKQNYEVFLPVTGKTSCDLIAIKDNEILRVQVKCVRNKTAYGSWTVDLRCIRTNKTQNNIKKFNAHACDVVAVFIPEEDRVEYLESLPLHGRSAINIQGSVAESGLRH